MIQPIRTINEAELHTVPHGVYRLGENTVRVQPGDIPAGVSWTFRRSDGMAVIAFALEPGWDFYELHPCAELKCSCGGAGHNHLVKAAGGIQ